LGKPFLLCISALRSIERYRSVEKSSGVSFFTECGFLAITKEEKEISSKGTPDLFHQSAMRVHTAGSDCWPMEHDDFPILELPKYALWSILKG